MNIQSVRLGFANNSSSSHSIILDSPVGEFNEGGMEYGWGDFLLKSKENKTNYLAVTLAQNLSRNTTSDLAKTVVKGLFGLDFHYDKDEYNVYIDHQSLIDLPYEFNSNIVNLDFFKDLSDYILENEHISIAGGNDNEDAYEYGGVVDPVIAKLPTDYHSNVVCRRDGDYWVLFNKDNGTKVRLSFVNKAPYTQSTYPELVDLKITDFCPFGCDFCYQGSTLAGKHVHERDLYSIIYTLQRMKVFEIALGGGETTLHPHFPKILDSIKRSGISANFTTFTTKWSDNVKQAIVDNASSFALSMSGSNDINGKLKDLAYFRDASGYKGQISIQLVLELTDHYQINAMFEAMQRHCFKDMTLLGFKSFGRGKDVQKTHKPDMMHILSQAKKTYTRLSVDTVILDRYQKELDEFGVQSILKVGKEGTFSMYIDAVNKAIAKDSYTDGLIHYNEEHEMEKLITANFPFC